jgi:hypothetical protein
MNYFDADYYYNKYKELEKHKINHPIKLLRHWVKFGFKENRTCNKIFESINLNLLKKQLNKNDLIYFENIFNILLKEYNIEEFNISNEYIIERFKINKNYKDPIKEPIKDPIKEQIKEPIKEPINKINDDKICMFSLSKLDNKILENINKNIDIFLEKISHFKNILFLCGDYPGYGGAATNCYEIQTFLHNRHHNTYGLYYLYEKDDNNIINNNNNYNYNNYKIININELEKEIKLIQFKPDLIILKSPSPIDLKYLNIPIYFLIGGIFTNQLNDYYYNISSNCQYFNKFVLKQIEKCDIAFSNSSHTQEILLKNFNLKTEILYTTFIPFYKKSLFIDNNFNDRKYEYGLIVSNFNRSIKNVSESINFLKDKKNVILIGKNSSQYKKYGFECIDLVDHNQMFNYYKQIKYIVQDSFYESCSNVKIEGLFNGCRMCPIYVISSTQYPGYGGAATNAYKLIKYIRSHGFKVAGLFFNNVMNVNYDPDNIGGIFLQNENGPYDKNIIIKYLKRDPTICLAKNYVAPILSKKIFNCYTVYLVSGINQFASVFKTYSANQILDINFKIIPSYLIKQEEECINISDIIVFNSKLLKNIFHKIYPQSINKSYDNIINTTINTNNEKKNNKKEYDILICCSSLNRIDKNNHFLINLLNNKLFTNYKKCIIGNDNEKFKQIPNATIFNLLEHDKCLEYISKSKILLIPSLFEANSNTIQEAIINNCLPLITKNVGNYENFPDYLICDNFDEIEWINKLLYLLKNYDNININNISNENNSINEIFHLHKQIINIYTITYFEFLEYKKGLYENSYTNSFKNKIIDIFKENSVNININCIPICNINYNYNINENDLFIIHEICSEDMLDYIYTIIPKFKKENIIFFGFECQSHPIHEYKLKKDFFNKIRYSFCNYDFKKYKFNSNNFFIPTYHFNFNGTEIDLVNKYTNFNNSIKIIPNKFLINNPMNGYNKLRNEIIYKFKDNFPEFKFYGNDPHARNYFKDNLEPMEKDEYSIGNVPNHLRFLKKINKFKEYKFILVCENQKIFSYVSEKLIDAMSSGSLPIYYGFDDIDKFFPDIFDNAVINGHRLSYDEIFKLIKNMTDDEWLMRINNIEKIIKKYLIFFTERTSIKYMFNVILKNYKLYDDNIKLLEHIQNTCIISFS